jgi:micrococcal nuclease
MASRIGENYNERARGTDRVELRRQTSAQGRWPIHEKSEPVFEATIFVAPKTRISLPIVMARRRDRGRQYRVCDERFYNLWDSDGFGGVTAFFQAPASDTLSASFSTCAGAARTNCVVDGDTFWFRGETIRIADIDTPELSRPRCAREAQLGEAAKRRLNSLLNAGSFSLSAGWLDEDQYGRKLRTVYRDGQSLGGILVSEGLARRWEELRRSWCD